MHDNTASEKPSPKETKKVPEQSEAHWTSEWSISGLLRVKVCPENIAQ